MNVSVHAAKTHLSRLLDLVEGGEEVIVERHGKPVAQLVAVHPRRAASAFGAMRGEITMTEGWERPLSDEEAEAFWGGR
jgi:prevent-host-death family protein